MKTTKITLLLTLLAMSTGILPVSDASNRFLLQTLEARNKRIERLQKRVYRQHIKLAVKRKAVVNLRQQLSAAKRAQSLNLQLTAENAKVVAQTVASTLATVAAKIANDISAISLKLDDKKQAEELSKLAETLVNNTSNIVNNAAQATAETIKTQLGSLDSSLKSLSDSVDKIGAAAPANDAEILKTVKEEITKVDEAVQAAEQAEVQPAEVPLSKVESVITAAEQVVVSDEFATCLLGCADKYTGDAYDSCASACNERFPVAGPVYAPTSPVPPAPSDVVETTAAVTAEAAPEEVSATTTAPTTRQRQLPLRYRLALEKTRQS